MTREEIVTTGSEVLWNRGVRILQGNRLAPTDEEHVDELARHMDLNGSEHNIVDMGCGFGEVSRLLASHAPSAMFWLVNNDEYQISKCLELPELHNILILQKDMLDTGLPDGFMDMVMFNFSLCLVDAHKALQEAARIVRPFGKLFVYDYERTGGNNSITQEHLFADFLRNYEFRNLCSDTGWSDVETIHPGGDDTLFREAVDDYDLYELMFRYLTPVIWKARK